MFFFLFHQIKGLETDLEKHWPDLYGNNSRFWSDEWVKHGTCSLNMFDQCAYFKLALDIKIRKARDLIHVLRDAGIVPKNRGSPYNTSSIVTAIKTTLHVDPIIICDRPRHKYLKEVRMCLDSRGTAFIHCPNATRKTTNSCNPKICLPQ